MSGTQSPGSVDSVRMRRINASGFWPSNSSRSDAIGFITLMSVQRLAMGWPS